MIVLGIDLGSSSIKAKLFCTDSGSTLGSCVWPQQEMAIHSEQAGWAEQDPQVWWQHTLVAVEKACQAANVSPTAINAVGIAYQMHGLVCVDEQQQPVGLANIWCDSRAVETGQAALEELGQQWCFTTLLNSPGNFTASKLKWMKDNQPERFANVDKIMLPGDYLAMRLSGKCTTTVSGLSEAMLWNYSEQRPAIELLAHWGISADLLPPVMANFSSSLCVSDNNDMGLQPGVPISYRSGDQPNNAFSLNVRHGGELAATGGTSAVLYAVSDNNRADKEQRVNTFAHVNPDPQQQPTGLLMCLNGGGRAYAWLRELLNSHGAGLDYNTLNALAAQAPVGANGLLCLPFGNGVERIFQNQPVGGHFAFLDFNRHSAAHMARATLEGIAFAMRFGFDHLQSLDCATHTIRASHGNLFQSDLFSTMLATLTGCPIDLINTDGAEGAARGAALGADFYTNADSAFASLDVQQRFTPDPLMVDALETQYQQWLHHLQHSHLNRN